MPAALNLDPKQLNERSLLIIDAYNRGLDNVAGYRQSVDKWRKFMTPADFDQRTALFPFILPTVQISKTADGAEPQFTPLIGKSVQFTLERWTGGVSIDKIDFNYPRFRPQYLEQASSLPINVEYEKVVRMFNALNLGESDPYYTVYDGKQFFAQDHLVGALGKQWSNLIDGTGTELEDLEADLESVFVNYSLVPWGPGDKFMNIDGANYTVVAHPKLKKNFAKLRHNAWSPLQGFYTENRAMDYMGDADINNMIDIRFSNLLSSTAQDDWYVIIELPGMSSAFVEGKLGENLYDSSLRVDMTPGGPADLKGQYRWWIETWFEVFPNHFFLVTKIVNS